ncbi:late competence development ComFB family protein [Aminipila sp.]|uniref:late competence development ComFB family protein n=1 Tax=Aminipila sp. TaxID=2060095 RepID=UPI0028A13548|nr:late competence development ComFB family protein [Aminipila sp.]
MPKKSNKTAHVLSLLTNGSGEFSEESIPVSKVELEQRTVSETSRKEVVVELQGSTQPDILSDLVKSDLEKELNNELSKKSDSSATYEEDPGTNERPPYSTTFMAKFGIQQSPEKETPKVKSEVYILEDFNDEEEVAPIEHPNITPVVNIESCPSNVYNECTKALHNLAEEAMKTKVPEIMQSFNMCTCQDCVYAVMALALNHIKPLYTVIEKDQLFQKLASYELQYGTDLASEITKACIKVKINPNHPSPNKK